MDELHRSQLALLPNPQVVTKSNRKAVNRGAVIVNKALFESKDMKETPKKAKQTSKRGPKKIKKAKVRYFC